MAQEQLSISDIPANITPREMRHIIREGRFSGPTSGLCPGYAQGNLIVLPKEALPHFGGFGSGRPLLPYQQRRL